MADLFDISGDGLPDRVMRRASGSYDRLVVELNTGPFPDLMCCVSNGLGGKLMVSYVPSTAWDNRNTNWVTDPWTEGTKSLLPFPVYTVHQISVYDGLTGTNTTTYGFKGGFFDFAKREFRGFSLAAVQDPLGTVSRTYFHQSGGRDENLLGEYQDQNSVAKKGIPYRVEIIGTNGLTNRITLNKVEEVQLHANGRFFPFLSQTIVMNYEGLSTYRATAKQLEYDTNTGNLTKDISLGEVTSVNTPAHTFTDATTADNLYTHTTYASLANANILNKPSSIKISTDSAGNNRLRETQFKYEGTRGNLTNTLVWLNPGNTFISTGRIEYDQYGNPVKSTDAANIITLTRYDGTYHQYPTQQVTATFTNWFVPDPRSGQTIMAIDAKGLVASNYFDVFFRPKESYISTAAYGAPTLWQAKLDYGLGGISGGISYNYVHKRVNDAVDAVNGYETYAYADGIGRGIQSRAEAENGEFRVGDTLYDERGNPIYSTLPYFSSGSSFTKLNGTYLGTLTDYDSVGRAYLVTPAVQTVFSAGVFQSISETGGDTGSPVGSVETAFKDGSNPWASVVIDPEGKVKKSYSDAFGRVTNITEATSGGNFKTHYRYDLLGNLTNVTDNAGNKTHMVYDSLGRKTRMTDPDMGTWTYAYDNAGRLTTQVDARGTEIYFSYSDSLGRLTWKEVWNPYTWEYQEAKYIYDVAFNDPSCTVFKGQLYRVYDDFGIHNEKYSYDVRGRVLKSFRTVNSTEYVTETTYDDADRVRKIIYPGSSATVTNVYDTAGNLVLVKSLAGTASQEIFYRPIAFNELGQVTSYTNGAGTVTTNIFYANSKRLKQIKTTSKTSVALQDLTYTYDKVSNIKSIAV